jgi:hypothetical protein
MCVEVSVNRKRSVSTALCDAWMTVEAMSL